MHPAEASPSKFDQDVIERSPGGLRPFCSPVVFMGRGAHRGPGHLRLLAKKENGLTCTTILLEFETH